MPSTKLKLVVEKGPTAGTELTLSDGSVSVGRSPRSGLVLKGDDFVSTEHATIAALGDVWSIHNLSPNGTLVNGRPVTDSPLVNGDKISVGLQHLITVRTIPVARPAVPVPTPSSPSPQSPAGAAIAPPVRSGPKLPMWLMVYFGFMMVALVALVIVKTTSAGTVGFADVRAREQQHAAKHDLPVEQTSRVLWLLETATVHERRGDARSAYEAYREVLGARTPIDPQSPAYRYAAARIAALGPK